MLKWNLGTVKSQVLKEDRLMALIHSLSPNEKRKLSIRTEQTEIGKLYSLLKDIRPGSEFDEQTAKKAFPKKLISLKNGLKGQILRSLESAFLKSSEEGKLNQQFNTLMILQERGLFEEMISRYKKLERQLSESGKSVEIIRLLSFRERKADDFGDDRKTILETQKKIAHYSKVQFEESELRSIRAQVVDLISENVRMRKEKPKAAFHKLLASSILSHPPEYFSVEAQRDYHFVKCQQYRFEGRKEEALAEARRLVDISPLADLPENSAQRRDNLFDCKMGLCNYLVVCDYFSESHLFEQALSALDAVLQQAGKGELLTLNTKWFLSLRYYLSCNKLELIPELSQEIDDQWEQLIVVIPYRRRLAYAYNLAIGFWFLGELNASYKWLSELLRAYHKNHDVKDLIVAGRVILHAIKADMPNQPIVTSLDSTRRTIAGNELLLKYEKKVFYYFSKLESAPSQASKNFIYKDFIEALENLKGEDVNFAKNTPPSYLELQYWLRSKIEGKTMLELL